MHKTAIDPGLIGNTGTTCHQLEAPDIPEPHDPTIPQATAESTFQLPFGQSSALSELRLGNLKSVEALLLTVLNYRSNWDSGKTWKSSLRVLSNITGLSIRYIRDTLSSLTDTDWIQRIATGTNTGSRYRVTHHNCSYEDIPTDKNGNQLKCAIPQGKGGILERLFNGDISWKAALIWILLKLHSDWKTGITLSLSIETIRQWVRMSPQTVSNCIQELQQAGLLKRLSKKNETGKYQLYPKPNAKPKPVHRRRKRKEQKRDNRDMKIDGNWRLSFNQLWRVNVETCEIQTRRSRGKGLWRNLTLGDSIPKAIQRDFDLCTQAYHNLQTELQEELETDSSVTDTAQSVTDTAQSVTDTAQGIFSTLFQRSHSKG